MATLFYSPAIRILIEVQNYDGSYQTIDVSDDVSDGSLALNENSPHQMQLTLTNHRRKYDGLFTPNDRIVIQMRRIVWLQVFSGYLSQVPLISALQRSVTLTAECTLKKLRFFPYDPGSEAFTELMNGFMASPDDNGVTTLPDGEKVRDGGMAARIKAVLTKVVGWGEDAIHIGKVPVGWTEKIDSLYEQLVPIFGISEDILGGASVGSGAEPGSDPPPPTTTTEVDPTRDIPTGDPSEQRISRLIKFESGVNPPGMYYAGAGMNRPHVMAAYAFIQQNWIEGNKAGVYVSSMWRPGGGGTHGGGQAMDISVPGTAENQEVPDAGREIINSIIAWFMEHPYAFGLSQIIWMKKYTNGGAWQEITAGQLGSFGNFHTNHVHLNFVASGPTTMVTTGEPWPNRSLTDIDPRHPVANGPGAIGGTFSSGTENNGPAFINAGAWFSTPDPSSDMLTGPRLLMNDTPEILPQIASLCRLSMRSFCSAPNGDFIAWFPDYFGIYGTAGRLVVKPIELKDFTVAWTDERLKTHEFVVGADTGFGSESASSEQEANQFATHGIVSVDFPPVLEALMGIQPADPIWGSPEKIYKRFGARPETRPFSDTSVFTTRQSEFWAALWYFQRNWAEQFSADIPMTFMPELFPGMIIEIEELGFQCYVTNVNHSWDFSDGGGFRTTASVIAPSVTNIDPTTGRGKGFRGLVFGKSTKEARLKIEPQVLGTPVGGGTFGVPNIPPAYLPTTEPPRTPDF